jgi:serine/threonine protein kinase
VVSDLIGKKLGDYVIERQLAIGGMATIYVGVDAKLGRKAAIKVLLPDVAGRDDTLTARFEREARAIANLEHENIIPIYQFGQQDNLYFLAMRYVEGDDLASIVTQYTNDSKLMPFDRALNILDQVAAALDYAHTQGIVHRDVKPSNVLVSTNDRVYLSDFGLVLYQTGDQTLGTAFGTPRYISPEQATDSTLATAKSDIYSLAVIVYEIVTGQRLFKGKTPMEIALSHITEAPQPPRAINPEISGEMQSVILRSLEKDPNLRHPTAKAFIDELRQAYERKHLPQLDTGDVTHPDSSGSELFDTRDLQALHIPQEEAIKPAPVPSDLDEAPTITPLPAELGSLPPPTIATHPDRIQAPAPADSITNASTMTPLSRALHDLSIARKNTNRGLIRLVAGVAAAIILLFVVITAPALLSPPSISPTPSPSPQAAALAATETAAAETTDEVLPPAIFTTTETPAAEATAEATPAPEQTDETNALPSETTEPTPLTIQPSATGRPELRLTRTAAAATERALSATPASRPSSTSRPTRTPSQTPTLTPTNTPTPTDTPTLRPTRTPSQTPTLTRTPSPTASPTPRPSNTPRPTQTSSPTESATVSQAALSSPLVMRYTPDLFALTNVGDTTQVISALTFTGLTDTETFVNAPGLLGDQLSGGACVLILVGGRNVSAPAEWNCGSARQITINTAQTFWRADSASDEVFTFDLAGTRITCQTVGRAVGRLDEGLCEAR